MEFEDIIYEKRDGIARIILNRPEILNAVRLQTFKELLTAYTDAGEDTSVGVIITTGAGDKAFSVGGDVNEFQDISGDIGMKIGTAASKLALEMKNTPKPIIAAVNGLCFGWGNEYLIFCDMAIASEDAVISQPELIVGSSPMLGVTEMLPLLIGQKRAREFIFMAKRLKAKEAEQIGLINKVVPKDKLEVEVEKWCRIVLKMSPQAVRLAKTSMNASDDMLYPFIMHAVRMWRMMHGTEEWKEGMKAFLEKREPDFTKFRK